MMDSKSTTKGKKSSDHDIIKLKPGEAIRLGNSLYVRCEECGSFVKLNKPIFGSLHICA